MGAEPGRDAPPIPPEVGENVARLVSTEADQIQALKDQLALSVDALEQRGAEVDTLKKELELARDEADIRRKAVRAVFRLIWLAPLGGVALLYLLTPWSLSLCIGRDCSVVNLTWFALIRLSEFAQLALITGPFVLILTLLGLVLKGVFASKKKDETIDGVAGVVAALEKLKKGDLS